MHDLFRVQAIQHRHDRIAGEIIFSRSPRMVAATVAIAVLVVAAALVFMAVPLDITQRVTGVIVPDRGLIVARAGLDGVVTEVLVEEREKVLANDPIARLNSQSRVNSGLSLDVMSDLSGARREAAELLSLSQEEALAREEDGLRRAMTLVDREISELRRREGSHVERASLAGADVERLRRLAAQGFLPARELLAAENRVLEIEVELSDVRSRIIEKQREQMERRDRLAAIPAERAAQRASSLDSRTQIDQAARVNEARLSQVVAAPSPGTVAAVSVSPGQYVSANTPVAVLVPQGADLVATLFVPSRYAGTIAPGQPVKLVVDAFPHYRHGFLTGRVASVSAAATNIANYDWTGLPRFESPVFEVRIDLSNSLSAFERGGVTLRPGLTVRAEIVVARRSIFDLMRTRHAGISAQA